MRVLVACEYSGIVRDAFIRAGHAAWSCDILPSEGRTLGEHYPHFYPAGHQLYNLQQHHQGDIFELFYGRTAHNMALELQTVTWDLLIAHPPCTRLTNAGVRWLAERNLWDEMAEGAAFFNAIRALPVRRKCLENPVMHKYARARYVDHQRRPCSLGSSASLSLSVLASGSTTCRHSYQHWYSTHRSRAPTSTRRGARSTAARRAQTARRSVARASPASRMRWPHSGVY